MLRSEMEDFVETRGAKPLWADKNKFAEYLINVDNGETVLTAYMKSRLLEEDYIIVVTHDSNGLRGRPGSHIEFTSKAKKVINLYNTRKAAMVAREKRKLEKASLPKIRQVA
jgi:hypothetical protein